MYIPRGKYFGWSIYDEPFQLLHAIVFVTCSLFACTFLSPADVAVTKQNKTHAFMELTFQGRRQTINEINK